MKLEIYYGSVLVNTVEAATYEEAKSLAISSIWWRKVLE